MLGIANEYYNLALKTIESKSKLKLKLRLQLDLAMGKKGHIQSF